MVDGVVELVHLTRVLEPGLQPQAYRKMGFTLLYAGFMLESRCCASLISHVCLGCHGNGVGDVHVLAMAMVLVMCRGPSVRPW